MLPAGGGKQSPRRRFQGSQSWASLFLSNGERLGNVVDGGGGGDGGQGLVVGEGDQAAV